MAAAILVLYLALGSHLDELAETSLAMHMVQHLVLMLIVAPLFVLARPAGPLLWCWPKSIRSALGRAYARFVGTQLGGFLSSKGLAWAAFCGVIALWHIPATYRWGTSGEVGHMLMHMSFLAAGVMFWSIVLSPGRNRAFPYAARALYVVSAALVTGLPGALIALAQKPLYQLGTEMPNPLGLSALADQQLAGLIMWIPMDLVLFAVAVLLFGLSLSDRPAQSSAGARATSL